VRAESCVSRRMPAKQCAVKQLAMTGDQTLTPMERKVVRLVSLGCSAKQAGAILGLRQDAVACHRDRAMGKLRVTSRAQLTRRAILLGVSALGDQLDPEEKARMEES
jgi:DNA-binding CsgD family transcriptional regulator